MIENYYKKYHLSKKAEVHERNLKLLYKHCDKILKYIERRKEELKRAIGEIELRTDLSDFEKRSMIALRKSELYELESSTLNGTEPQNPSYAEEKKAELEKAVGDIQLQADLSDIEKKRLIALRKEELLGLENITLSNSETKKVIESAFLDEEEMEFDDGLTKEDRITNAYMLILYRKKVEQISRKEKAALESLGYTERKSVLEDLNRQREELGAAYKILSDPEKRREYLKEIQKIEYIEQMEADRAARINLSKIHVKSVLGEDFDPNMSDTQENVRKTVTASNKKGYTPFSWEARLYNVPEKLLIGKSKHPNMPQLDSDVYAYRYGTLVFSSFFKKSGEPTYRDSLSEIIGVTKIDQNGEERTNFVIAPLTEEGQILEVTEEEYRQLLARNLNPIPVKIAEDYKFDEHRRDFLSRVKSEPQNIKIARNTDKNSGFTRVLKSATTTLKDFVIGEEQHEEKVAPRAIDIRETKRRADRKLSENTTGNKAFEQKRHVFLSGTIKREVKPEEFDFFATVYFSDYLIDNAVRNNAGYLGSYTNNKGIKNISFNSPMEKERIAACFYASENSGKVTRPDIFKRSPQIEIIAGDINALFATLKEQQRNLVSVARKSVIAKKEKEDESQVL